MADKEYSIPMTPQSRMLAASIGKSFVAATCVAMAQEGVLDLDRPVADWLGEYLWFDRLPSHDIIALRQLLNHTFGLPVKTTSEPGLMAWLPLTLHTVLQTNKKFITYHQFN